MTRWAMASKRGIRGLLFVGLVGLVMAEAALAGEPAIVPSTLRPTAGQPMSLELNLPKTDRGGEVTWANANLGQFFVRTGERQQSLLPLNVGPDEKRAPLQLDSPGPAMLCVGVGPPEARGQSDSWQRTTHCTKIVLNVQPKEPNTSPPAATAVGVTGKTGQKIEIQPLMDPSALKVGDDLAVRVHYEGSKVKDAKLTATITPGDVRAAGEVVDPGRPTDAEGSTWFKISKTGTWIIRFEHEVKDENNPSGPPRRYVAELIFEVAKGAER